jgi:predicted metal-dependent enzyme (double-stranded beta helix superfamily)
MLRDIATPVSYGGGAFSAICSMSAAAMAAVRLPKVGTLPEPRRATPEEQGRPFPASHTEERIAVARFVARVGTLGPLSQASPDVRVRLLEEVQALASIIDASGEAGLASGYDRRVLHEDPAGWSLAAIVLRPGQQIDPHDHGGWGCAATVQGVERDRRFVHGSSDKLIPAGEHDYPPGTGYAFDALDVHQPFGADPRRVTVALHFLVHGLG